MVAVFGGAPIRNQVEQLGRGGQVVVGTVGRVMDLMSRHKLILTAARYVVLDEADEMLDLGFLEDVETILSRCPSGRQTGLFSATIPPEIKRLAETWMFDPETIKVQAATLTIDTVEQFYVEVSDREKPDALAGVLKSERPEQAIIFVRTKIGVDRLARSVSNRGVRVKALHGDMSQGARDGVMIAFKDGRERLLVATDIAARGLDISGVTHILNYDMPNSPDLYVHRIGRTGRVGRSGRAITFVTPRQRRELEAIERHAGIAIAEWSRDGGAGAATGEAANGGAPSAGPHPPQRAVAERRGASPSAHEAERALRWRGHQARRGRRPRTRPRAGGRDRGDRGPFAARGRGRAQREGAGAVQPRRGARRPRRGGRRQGRRATGAWPAVARGDRAPVSRATLHTSQGPVTVELFDGDAPKTVDNFRRLASEGFYDGLIFHRVIPSFMVQGGCPQGTGTGGPGYTFEDEINEHRVERGALAMANAGPDTNGSQFFLVTAEAAPWLDGKHTVFGRVDEGMEVVDAIEALPTDERDRPLEPPAIERIELQDN